MWSVKCKCEVWSPGCEVWRKCLLGVALHRGRTGHVLGQQPCNRFAQSAHGPWLVHGACKFYYRWKRSYIITLRQLPPRLVRVLLVPSRMGINNHDNPCGNWRFAAVQFPISSQSWHASDVERPEIASSSCWSVQILGSTRCAPRFAPHGQMAQAVPCCQDPFAIVVANIKVLKRKNKSSNTQLWHVDTPWINRIIVWFVQKLGTPNNPMHWSYVGFPYKIYNKRSYPILGFSPFDTPLATTAINGARREKVGTSCSMPRHCCSSRCRLPRESSLFMWHKRPQTCTKSCTLCLHLLHLLNQTGCTQEWNPEISWVSHWIILDMRIFGFLIWRFRGYSFATPSQVFVNVLDPIGNQSLQGVRKSTAPRCSDSVANFLWW